LDGKRADAAGRTVDKNFLPELNFSFVPQRLQRGYSRYVDRSRFLETHIRRFQRDCSSCPRTHILRKRTTASAKDFIAVFELCDVFADGFHRSRKIDT
jgi:hypothetical protein